MSAPSVISPTTVNPVTPIAITPSKEELRQQELIKFGQMSYIYLILYLSPILIAIEKNLAKLLTESKHTSQILTATKVKQIQSEHNRFESVGLNAATGICHGISAICGQTSMAGGVAQAMRTVLDGAKERADSQSEGRKTKHHHDMTRSGSTADSMAQAAQGSRTQAEQNSNRMGDILERNQQMAQSMAGG